MRTQNRTLVNGDMDDLTCGFVGGLVLAHTQMAPPVKGEKRRATRVVVFFCEQQKADPFLREKH